MSNTAVQPSFSTICCKTLNIFIKVCYSSLVAAAMQARRAFDPFSIARSRPTWSYHQTGTLPRLIFFVCHSYAVLASRTILRDENTGGHCFHRALRASRSVGVFFPFWNSTASPAPSSSNKTASPFVGLLSTDAVDWPLPTIQYYSYRNSKLR